MLQDQFFGETELMVIPAVASLEKPKRLKKWLYMFSDVVYFSARYLLAAKYL
jgi:hypothetical protein